MSVRVIYNDQPRDLPLYERQKLPGQRLRDMLGVPDDKVLLVRLPDLPVLPFRVLPDGWATVRTGNVYELRELRPC